MRKNNDPEKKVIDFAKAHKKKTRQLSRRKQIILAAIAVAAVVGILVLLLLAFQLREAVGGGDFWQNFQ